MFRAQLAPLPNPGSCVGEKIVLGMYFDTIELFATNIKIHLPRRLLSQRDHR